MKKISFLIVLIAFITSCGASKSSNSTQAAESTYQKLATEKLGEDLTFTMNKAETYVLCISDVKGDVHQPRNLLSYMVIKVKDNSIALEDKIDGGNVKWSNDFEIEVFRTPGIMRDDQTRDDFITMYNVESGKSYPKKNTEQH